MNYEFLVSFFVEFGYWIIFVGILLDNAGLPIPGEVLLLAFGALARTGHVDLGLGILVASAAAMGGDSVGYWLGRFGGERLLQTYCRVTLGSSRCVQRAVAFYQLRGRAAVVFGRFVVGVRAFLFPLAGSARMPYSQFLLFDGVGAVAWASLFVLAGFGVGWQVAAEYRTASALLAGILGTGFAAHLLLKLYRRRRHGPAAFRERILARVRYTLPRRRASARLPAAASGATNPGGSTGPSSLLPLVGAEDPSRDAQACPDLSESPRPTAGRVGGKLP